jgi:demethoxyubiquinone hydroxylase (CLK1/Coq7/Cat5 family)
MQIPAELLEIQQDLIVSMDGLEVNSLKFLSTISHELYYRTTQYITRTPVKSVYKVCMDELLAVYKKGGFKITEIHCDNEFCKGMEVFLAKQDPRIKMNYAAAQEHLPQAERNNRIIQERVRAAYHRFFYAFTAYFGEISCYGIN